MCRCLSTRLTGSCRSSTSSRSGALRWPGCSAWRRCPTTATATGRVPAGERLDVQDVRFSYVEGRDVCTASTSTSQSASGSRWSGPPERQVDAGPAAGGHPSAPHRLGDGRRGGARRAATRRPARPRRPGHPGAPRLRRHAAGQPGLAVPRPAPVTTRAARALAAVDAREWVDALPEGLDTVVGSGGRALTAAQAQQVRWPGWCWPTRTPWCSTRRPR